MLWQDSQMTLNCLPALRFYGMFKSCGLLSLKNEANTSINRGLKRLIFLYKMFVTNKKGVIFAPADKQFLPRPTVVGIPLKG